MLKHIEISGLIRGSANVRPMVVPGGNCPVHQRHIWSLGDPPANRRPKIRGWQYPGNPAGYVPEDNEVYYWRAGPPNYFAQDIPGQILEHRGGITFSSGCSKKE